MTGVTKAVAPKVSLPKTTLPKPKALKPTSMNKSPKMPSMNSYKSVSKATNGLKGAISKNNLSQLSTASLNQSY